MDPAKKEKKSSLKNMDHPTHGIGATICIGQEIQCLRMRDILDTEYENCPKSH